VEAEIIVSTRRTVFMRHVFSLSTGFQLDSKHQLTICFAAVVETVDYSRPATVVLIAVWYQTIRQGDRPRQRDRRV
jgi:hypothetical protein